MENSVYRLEKLQLEIEKDSVSYPELNQFAANKEEMKNSLMN